MKILHILDHSLPLHSGYAFRSRNIFKCQQDVGLEPVVVTSPKHEASWEGEWLPEETIDGVTYHRTGPVDGGKLPLIPERRLMEKLKSRIRDVARREKPDIIHAHSPVLNARPAIQVAREIGLPAVYEIRAFWEDAAADHGTYGEDGFKYRVVRKIETSACRKADRVVTICEGLRDDLIGRDIPAEKIAVVPNAVNAEEFTPVARDPELARRWELDGAFAIGFLGSFYHYEGLDLLIEAVARLTREPPGSTAHDSRLTTHDSRLTAHDSRLTTHDSRPLKLLLVGGGAMEATLKRQVADSGIGDRVIFTGRLPHRQMPAMYALTDVLCFPRKSMRLTDLVTPLKPLEAMAMGKPVVASDVGGHQELIRHGKTGLLFRAGSVEALSSELLKSSRDLDLRRHLISTAKEWVKRERAWGKEWPGL